MSVKSAGLTPPLSVRLGQWAERVALGRKLAIVLTLAVIASAIATYAALTPIRTDINTVLILLNLDLALFLILATVLARGLVRMWIERRRGAVGSRLHTRLVLLFSLIAIMPTLIVSISSVVFFSLGLQAWFSERVRTALQESDAVAQAYLKEHQQTIRGDILAMARDLSRAAPIIAENPARLQQMVATQATLRALSEVAVFDSSGRALARWSNLGFALADEAVPISALERARGGEPVLLPSESDDRIRALVKLDRFIDIYLFVSRFVEPGVIEHIERTRTAVNRYQELEGKRSTIEITFAMMFILVALLLLMAAVWIGLMFASRLTQPISQLVNAAERVRGGDLAARVDEGDSSDEIGTLNRAFNRMTEQMAAQRDGLVEANRQLDARRHFMETVLAGVSSGVIGLDGNGRIQVANQAAMDLLSATAEEVNGRRLDEIIPESAELLQQALGHPGESIDGEVVIRRETANQTLFVRLAPERASGDVGGFVVTFDDISELLAAQRKAAWSDVARRIAHEIKNPLTPIQLAAERLRRKYQKEIRSEPESFVAYTDTIIRQVGDIGRLVDEFSAFARMPAPLMKPEDVARICRESTVLLRSAHPGIDFACNFDDRPVEIFCDRRQVGQALTNLMQNAVEAIEARAEQEESETARGKVEIDIRTEETTVAIVVSDNGIGLPRKERDRLTEPYVTTREKGTGLGLAIVRKIMEDHSGMIRLEDGAGGGARVSLIFPAEDVSKSVSTAADEGTKRRRKGAVTHGA